ncbi:MAG: ABC transporter permease [Candidatus Omnitrophica bacterium]|nr:ABC transporter permease [Candidatus Omnitrophota bacterium]
MFKYSLKRLFLAIPLLLGITFITFLFIQLAPGNFLDNLKLNPQINKETIKIYQEKFFLDKPPVVQYLIWLQNILKADFGYSFSFQAPVKKIILSRTFNTLLLSISTIIFSWILVIPLGIICGYFKNKFIDRIILFFSYLGISSPSFFLAFIFLYFAYITRLFPLGGRTSVYFDQLSYFGKFLDLVKHLILPVLVLSIGRISSLIKIFRSNILETLGLNYILALKARGIGKRRIFFVHILRAAINPLVTIFGYEISSLLSGAALVEIIFGWPGLGQVMLEAVGKQDIYLVMGSVLISGMLLILGNFIADILLAFFDPRIRLK